MLCTIVRRPKEKGGGFFVLACRRLLSAGLSALIFAVLGTRGWRRISDGDGLEMLSWVLSELAVSILAPRGYLVACSGKILSH
jgi:hypothetical protein